MINECSYTGDKRLNTLDLRFIADKAPDHDLAIQAVVDITNYMSENNQDSLDYDALTSALLRVGLHGLQNIDSFGAIH